MSEDDQKVTEIQYVAHVIKCNETVVVGGNL